jgi:hypothetical protein
VTLISTALLEGERPALLRKAVEVALDGDVPMLKFRLGRLLPRDRLLQFELPPMQFADDGVDALGGILPSATASMMRPSGSDLDSVD